MSAERSPYAVYWKIKEWLDEDKVRLCGVPYIHDDGVRSWRFRSPIDLFIFTAFNQPPDSAYTDLIALIDEKYPWFWGPHGLVLFKALLIKRGMA